MTTQASRMRIRARHQSHRQRGMALITTLLLLILLSLLGLTMAVTANSDMLINSYYGSYRGAFYAADSGLNIARANMLNSLTSTTISGQMNMNPCVAWGAGAASGCTSPPLNGTTAASNAPGNTTTSGFNSLNAGQAAASWSESYMIPTSISSNGTSCTTSITFPTTGNPAAITSNASGVTGYQYTFNYEICAVGRAQGLQQINDKEDGTAYVTVTANSTGGVPTPGSFASFGAFIDNFGVCQGPLAAGSMSGRFFTNGAWNFGTGSYTFNGPVGQHNADADYWISNQCYQSPTTSYSHSGNTISPTYNQGVLQLNQSAVTLPADNFHQEWAVLDGIGNGTETPSTPTKTGTGNTLNSYLKDINGNAYPTSGASSGVFIPYCTTNCSTYPGATGSSQPAANTVLGGGFYIEDSASVTTNVQLSLGTSGGNPTQTYTITQGTTSTAITLNINANTTTIVSGTKTLTLSGYPKNLNLNNVSTEGAVLYVDGNIDSLKGPGQGQASIQDYYGTTVTATGNITVNGDLIYNHEPVQLNSTDALIPGNDYNQVLGIYTPGGNIIWSSGYSNHNLEIDATMAAMNGCSSNGGTCPLGSGSYGFATSGTVGTLTIVGGRIESYAHSVSLSAANTFYDQRFTTRTNFAPPAFPSSTFPATGPPTPLAPNAPTASTQRTSWMTWPQ